MSKIHMLDQNTINKIAAGEVVERPSSVVKDLVENAIDAKATAITVEIKGGGLELIRITDNGLGIDKLDIRSAFLRHSTSKIKLIEDLMHVASLGFRGEALASIASIASVELLTKTQGTTVGSRYLIEGGKEISFTDVGCPDGTTIIINQLFYNTPVRKKFLKSASTEGGYVSELMSKLALGHPEIAFKFILNGTVKLHTSGNGDLEDVIFNVYGKDATGRMVPIHKTVNQMTIIGFLGKPELARANRNYENYYINGRYIKSRIIQKAIEDAFSSKLILHRFPFVVLHIVMSGDEVDVNVHPTKMDVRFNDEKGIYDQIHRAVNQTLNQEELIPEVTFSKVEKEAKHMYDRDIPEPFENRRKDEGIVHSSGQYAMALPLQSEGQESVRSVDPNDEPV
ncbi:MAG: DNA mismatch repair endonuclease MutL [Vallitaleaceae bacterium]|jgi:DNA mismatch repair protein MutL|nr:DNA mismatch repair endonuclease MutL [Vallitaleaceae bacterium]